LNLSTSACAGREINDVLRTIAEAKGRTAFFCKAGKDRTGIIAALILSLFDTPREQIIDDYAESDGRLSIAYGNIDVQGLDMKLFESAPPEAMEATLRFIDRQWGDVGRYLSSIGFTDRWQKKLIINLSQSTSEYK